MDNQYYEEEISAYQLQYSSPDPDYYNSPIRMSQKPPHDPNSYYPPPPDPADILHWYTQGQGKELYYMGTDFIVRKQDLLKVEKPERDSKITDNK